MRILWVVYGSLDRLSGGNLYDRLVVDHLRAHGAQVEVLGLPQPPYPLGPPAGPAFPAAAGGRPGGDRGG